VKIEINPSQTDDISNIIVDGEKVGEVDFRNRPTVVVSDIHRYVRRMNWNFKNEAQFKKNINKIAQGLYQEKQRRKRSKKSSKKKNIRGVDYTEELEENYNDSEGDMPDMEGEETEE
jgi:hypothetical protein